MSSIFTFWYSVYFFDDLQHELLGIIIDRGAAIQVCDYFRRNAGISSGKLPPVEIFDSLASCELLKLKHAFDEKNQRNI